MSYEQLQKQLIEKEETSGAYKAYQGHKRQCEKELKKLLLLEHRNPGRSPKRQQHIEVLDRELKQVENDLQERAKKSSRLKRLVEEGYERLQTRNKEIMDALKILARNSFYKGFSPFKEAYNNYRDEHDYFQILSRSDGMLIEKENEVEVHLFPTGNLSPSMQLLMRNYLEEVNAKPLYMPDDSGRKIIFRLGDKSGFQFAFVE